MLLTEWLSVSTGGSAILFDVSISVGAGEIVALIGPNGSGKSSFSLALLGHPDYRIDAGHIWLDGEMIESLPPEERSARGLFLAMQKIPEIPGIRIGEYLRTLANARAKRGDPQTKPISPFVFARYVRPFMQRIGIPESFLDRDLNVGFSGGERRRMELLQAFVLEPSVLVFDETDSGLDMAAVANFATVLPELATRGAAVLVITHNQSLLESVPFVRTYELAVGRVVRSCPGSLLT